MTHPLDPGWGKPLKGLGYILIPMWGLRRALESADALTALRQLWVGFTAAVVLIAGAVGLMWSTDSLGSALEGRAVAAGVFAVGVFVHLVGQRLTPGLNSDSAEDIREATQRSFLLRVAFAEVPALVGFMGFVLTGNPAVYLAGMVVALAGLSDIAPTASRLAQRQDEMRASGSDIDLVAVLVGGGLTR